MISEIVCRDFEYGGRKAGQGESAGGASVGALASPWMGFRVLRRTAAPPLFPKVLLRFLIELRLAALGAEIYGLPLVLAGGSSLFGINRHFAYRVNNLHDFTSRFGIFNQQVVGRRR